MAEVTIRCPVCDGSGEEEWSTMGVADNTDIDSFVMACGNCLGSGLESIVAEFTEDEVAA